MKNMCVKTRVGNKNKKAKLAQNAHLIHIKFITYVQKRYSHNI